MATPSPTPRQPATVTHAPPSAPALTPQDCAVLARLAHAQGGLVVDEAKPDFLEARLAPRLARLGLPDFAAYTALLQSAEGARELSSFVEALTTHTTSFFRESAQYDWLASQGLPALIAQGAGTTRDLVLWSAACSSGQELYSALIIVAEVGLAQGRTLACRGYGTDISRAILRRAEHAIYDGEEIAGIALERRRRYLLSAREGAAGPYRIVPELRERTRWLQANLLANAELPAIAADVIFVRNVLIYFDAATRARVLANIVRRLAPGGYLFTGHSETVHASDYGLDQIRPSLYHKVAPSCPTRR
ncbi:MAG: CheR family methyltransferase [Pseudomonadota bacterium]